MDVKYPDEGLTTCELDHVARGIDASMVRAPGVPLCSFIIRGEMIRDVQYPWSSFHLYWTRGRRSLCHALQCRSHFDHTSGLRTRHRREISHIPCSIWGESVAERFGGIPAVISFIPCVYMVLEDRVQVGCERFRTV